MKSNVKEDLIQEILRRTLDELSDWKPAILMPGVGPQHPEIHFDFKSKLDIYQRKIVAKLNTLPMDELQANYLMPKGSALNPLTKKHDIHFNLAKELASLKRQCPPWFGAGWSEKSHSIEIDYWTAVKTVNIDEAALMLVGVEPRLICYDNLFNAYEFDSRTDEVLYFLEDRFELLIRRFGEPKNGILSIPTDDLYAWVNETDLLVPLQFRSIIKNVLGDAPKTTNRQRLPDEPKDLHGSTRSMFQRALAVVAIEKYELFNLAGAAKAAGEIVESGDFRGFSLDKQNIAMQIRAGFGQLSEDEKASLVERRR